LEYVLRHCGDELTRENVMCMATHMDHVAFPMLLPGITASTSPTNYFPIKQFQMQRFDGEVWVAIGPIVGQE
jgi:branched-chain amino acid transport system substrate-binding protein